LVVSTKLSELRAAAIARRDPVLALALALSIFAAARFGPQPTTPANAAALAAMCGPLAWRSRWPLQVLATTSAAIVLYLGVGHVSNDVSNDFVPPFAVALYSCTASPSGSRRRTVVVAVLAGLFAIAIVLAFSPAAGSKPRQILGEMSLFAVGIAVGEAVRSQRALLDAMRERAERAEREQELEARRRVDAERLRMARDVHDLVAHNIATISTQAAVGVHVGRDDPRSAVEALENIKLVSTRALEDLRHALGVVRGNDPESRMPAPSLRDVAALIEDARQAGVNVELRMDGSTNALPAALQLAVYRIVQEGLTNVMRHAAGASAVVGISVKAEYAQVEVSNGVGTPTEASDAGSGSGLLGMRERTESLGGSFRAGKTAHGGFCVQAQLPLDGSLA
jgi:signal transduction histidine kinase